ncbi:DNA polymerase III subunit chi [Thiocapsa imhoffii]|uniref:DNA polymerase III subunit chi n=1 Tax=Thiocapsa imhoffii TaxID=382777 RepID=A0A9X0WI02_9GAMM|nr:DNA polymerase III subunit chi [Thiocapsa imhoffii]MBK1644923.1 DNA polymerase III subunit chi [Thiocapsa imhoffii]
MTRIDFYSLEPHGTGDRFVLTCRLVERIRATGSRILIHCPDSTQAEHLDRLLWTFREDSFIPHGRIGQTDHALTPVLISGDGTPLDEDEVLINLAPEVPTFFSRFARLCEPIDRDATQQEAGRARYRYYRDRGYPLHHHRLSL